MDETQLDFSSSNLSNDFLELAIRESHCDRFARKQFQHAAGGVYIEEEQLIQFRRFIERYEAGEIDNIDK